MKKFFAEFKAFAMRGNVLDMAVGVVIGGAFGKITTSLVNDILMPLLSLLTGGVDFSSWKWVLKAASVAEDGTEIAEIAVNYGSLIATILDFVLIAFAIFCLLKAVNGFHDKLAKKKAEEPAAPPAPSAEEKLLTEIRDLLKEKNCWKPSSVRVSPPWACPRTPCPSSSRFPTACWRPTRS